MASSQLNTRMTCEISKALLKTRRKTRLEYLEIWGFQNINHYRNSSYGLKGVNIRILLIAFRPYCLIDSCTAGSSIISVIGIIPSFPYTVSLSMAPFALL